MASCPRSPYQFLMTITVLETNKNMRNIEFLEQSQKTFLDLRKREKREEKEQ